MFKALILSLALASGLHATVNNTTPIENLNSGLNSAALVPVGTPVYSLNNALTGSASAAVDLSGTAGLMLCITSTGAANVTVYFSNSAVSSTGGAVSMYSVNANGCYPIEPKGRYVSFYNSSNQASNRVSVNYLPMVAAPIAVTASLNPITYTTVVNDTLSYGYLTTTAAGTAGRGGSFTAVALATAYQQNITTAAGVDMPCVVTIFPGTGPAAGFYWEVQSSSTWANPVSYLAVSTTPVMFTVGRGDFLALSATASTANIKVRYAPIY